MFQRWRHAQCNLRAAVDMCSEKPADIAAVSGVGRAAEASVDRYRLHRSAPTVQQHLSYLEHDPYASAAITDSAHRFLHVIQRQDPINVRPDFLPFSSLTIYVLSTL